MLGACIYAESELNILVVIPAMLERNSIMSTLMNVLNLKFQQRVLISNQCYVFNFYLLLRVTGLSRP
jgi:hypothetical protein